VQARPLRLWILTRALPLPDSAFAEQSRFICSASSVITFGGWIGYLIADFIGACILIAIARAFSGGLQQRT
jgi:hypothetical protein